MWYLACYYLLSLTDIPDVQIVWILNSIKWFIQIKKMCKHSITSYIHFKHKKNHLVCMLQKYYFFTKKNNTIDGCEIFLGYSRIIFTHFNNGSQGSYSSFFFFYGTRVFQSHVIQLCVLTYNFRLYKYYNRYGIAL